MRKPKFSLAYALAIHRNGCEFLWRDDQDDISGLEWSDETECPDLAVIEEWKKELEADWERSEYKRARAEAYPPIAEQLDLLFHQGYEGWKSAVQAVKDQFPKPA